MSTGPAPPEPDSPPGDTADCSAVVVAFNSAREMRTLVPEMVASDQFEEIVVVDNGDGGSFAIARDAGVIALHRPDNPGFGASQNQGVAATSTPFVILLNPDAELSCGALSAGLAWMRDHPDTAMVQGVIVNKHTGHPERSGGAELGPVHLLGRLLHLRHLLGFRIGRWLAMTSGLDDHVERTAPEPVAVETLAATAVLVRRSAYDAVGGFDERFFLYGEDLDLCRRLRLAGWTLTTLPIMWAIHQNAGSFTSDWERELQWWRGTMTFGAKSWDDRTWRRARVITFFRWLSLAARRPRRARSAWQRLQTEPREIRSSSGFVSN